MYKNLGGIFQKIKRSKLILENHVLHACILFYML